MKTYKEILWDEECLILGSDKEMQKSLIKLAESEPYNFTIELQWYIFLIDVILSLFLHSTLRGICYYSLKRKTAIQKKNIYHAFSNNTILFNEANMLTNELSNGHQKLIIDEENKVVKVIYWRHQAYLDSLEKKKPHNVT